MYFVVMPDGQKFGPADVATLNAWVQEGRLVGNSVVEDAATGQRMAANQIPGLQLPPPPMSPPPMGAPQPFSAASREAPGPYSAPPQHSPYERHMMPGFSEESNKYVTYAWIAAVASFACCAIISPIVGMVYGKKAKEMGHPSGHPAYVVNLVILILQSLFIILYLAIVIFALAVGGRGTGF